MTGCIFSEHSRATVAFFFTENGCLEFASLLDEIGKTDDDNYLSIVEQCTNITHQGERSYGVWKCAKIILSSHQNWKLLGTTDSTETREQTGEKRLNLHMENPGRHGPQSTPNSRLAELDWETVGSDAVNTIRQNNINTRGPKLFSWLRASVTNTMELPIQNCKIHWTNIHKVYVSSPVVEGLLAHE